MKNTKIYIILAAVILLSAGMTSCKQKAAETLENAVTIEVPQNPCLVAIENYLVDSIGKNYTPGDVFADGEELVNADDLYALRRYIAGYEVEGLNTDLNALDVNGDKYINEKDAFILERYIAGWDGYELARGNVLK